MTARGLSIGLHHTASFSKYRTDLVKLNNSLQSDLRNDDDKLTANYMCPPSSVPARQLGVHARCLFRVFNLAQMIKFERCSL